MNASNAFLCPPAPRRAQKALFLGRTRDSGAPRAPRPRPWLRSITSARPKAACGRQHAFGGRGFCAFCGATRVLGRRRPSRSGFPRQAAVCAFLAALDAHRSQPVRRAHTGARGALRAAGHPRPSRSRAGHAFRKPCRHRRSRPTAQIAAWAEKSQVRRATLRAMWFLVARSPVSRASGGRAALNMRPCAPFFRSGTLQQWKWGASDWVLRGGRGSDEVSVHKQSYFILLHITSCISRPAFKWRTIEAPRPCMASQATSASKPAPGNRPAEACGGPGRNSPRPANPTLLPCSSLRRPASTSPSVGTRLRLSCRGAACPPVFVLCCSSRDRPHRVATKGAWLACLHSHGSVKSVPGIKF